jgi:quercetin dioxygenase-like cupin family protein
MKALRWDDVPVEKVNGELSRQLVTGRNEMLTRVLLKQGAIVPSHSHESEQITWIFEGALKLWIGEPEQELLLLPGQFVVIPPHVPHRAEAVEDTVDVDIFSPIRQDWLDGSDDYLRRGRAAGRSAPPRRSARRRARSAAVRRRR